MGSLLGHAPVAATWADALGAATGRAGLRGITLLPWAAVLPSKNLLRNRRAWCPVCLDAWRHGGPTVYEPLLWQFSVVSACTRHGIHLRTRCRACGRRNPLVSTWGRPGHCICGASGPAPPEDDERLADDELDWQSYVHVQVGALIVTTPSLDAPVSAATTVDAVNLARARTGLTLTALAAAMGVALATVSLWKDGRRQPALPGVLRLCRVSGIELVDFLRGDLTAMTAATGPSIAPPYVPPSDEHHRTTTGG